MAEKRLVKCNVEGCDNVWESEAKPKNLKCKKCGSDDIQDNYVDPDATVTDEVVEPDEVKLVPKTITCPRCNGDGIWHTSATGRRLETISGPTVDPEKVCPNCKGKKNIVIRVPEQAAE